MTKSLFVFLRRLIRRGKANVEYVKEKNETKLLGG